MYFLTLNVHSHYDKMTKEGFQKALDDLARFIAEYSVDIIALQECSQSISEAVFEGTLPGSFIAVDENPPIRKDNFALLLAKKLEEAGFSYHWSYTGAKIGYDRFDEGLAIFSKQQITDIESFYFSAGQDYHNWKSRKAIGICTMLEGKKNWFYSVHMGWWKDEEDSFAPQMRRLYKRVSEKSADCLFLMGDFNSQDSIRGEGYDYVRGLGFEDTYLMAREKDSGVTVPGTIDGWQDVQSGMRIDYIFSSRVIPVKSAKVVFNGICQDVISDHFGFLIEI